MDTQLQTLTNYSVTVRVLTEALEAQGMQVYKSFDLRAALDALPDCGCPQHGTSQCTCQYSVLLVYGGSSTPAQLVIHGRGGKTWVSLPSTNEMSPNLRARIDFVLANTFSQLSSPQSASSDQRHVTDVT